ncbi:hypothetical protein [Candidatus Magnetaquicoccus inordinatus]|uniref:hypothetical protein n=1 Tax=Candidatus Magnetaquicoccus inordinatus TaxID=2496818 RepID=UPI00102D244E|nr:hypothetical protein [Candidatus Magnetaquicoccus inordinatus]
MRPRINLLQEELFSVKSDWLDAEKAFWILLVALALVLTGGLFVLGDSALLYWEVSQLQTQESVLKNRLAQLTAAFPKSEEDPALLERLAVLEKEIKVKKQVLELLSGQRIGNRHGFSGQFVQLARGNWPEMWLTQIQLLDGGRQVVFVGRTLKVGELFDFIKQLTGDGVFKGMQFPYFQMGAVQDVQTLPAAQTRFILATRLDLLQRAWKGDLSAAERTEFEKGQPGRSLLGGK